MNIILWCIHGNLQLPTVWDQFSSAFTYEVDDAAGNAARLPIQAENLWLDDVTDLWAWAELFCDRVRRQSGNYPQLLMGYSQGGRLALHSILRCPSLWRGAVLIGVNPGLLEESERQDHLRQDQLWAGRFLTEPWEEILKAWDSQPVFCGLPCNHSRSEKEFSREKIARHLDLFSVGRQDFLTERLATITRPPMLFISGEKDAKYCEIGRILKESTSVFRHNIIPNAGHRVPWENQEGFVKEVQNFINTIL